MSRRLAMRFGSFPPTYVKPFVKRGKTDGADAEAICEAVTRKIMRFVPIKSAERDLLVRQRTHAINALHSHLSELASVRISPPF